MALRFNTFRSKRYLRSKFVEGKFLLASEATDLELELVDLLRTTIESTIGNVSIDDAWKVTKLNATQLLISPGEAWFKGLPYIMRSGKDHLVSGASLTLGIVPAGVSVTDDSTGLGKILTFNDGSSTPTDVYKMIVSAREELITETDDGFLQNANLSESTAQKVRLNYRLDIVSASGVTETPIPYTNDITGENLVNQIVVTPAAALNGELISITAIPGAENIDGRDIDVVLRNDPALGGGNPIPNGSSDQQSFFNGTLIDSNGSKYHINAIFNDVVGTQVVLRIDKEFGQPNPEIINSLPITLIKRDVYVTDDANGNFLGKLFYPIADIDFDTTDGFVHQSSIADLRNSTASDLSFQNKTNQKFDLMLTEGGTVSYLDTVLTAATGTITILDNTFAAGDGVTVDGTDFINGVGFTVGGTTDLTAADLATQIDGLPNVGAAAVGSVITITASVAGAAGNSILMVKTDSEIANFALSAPNLTDGADDKAGIVEWTSGFSLLNPHGPTMTIAASNAAILDGGSLVYALDLDTGGAIEVGNLAVTITAAGATTTLSAIDISTVRVGNTISIGVEVAEITSIDDVNDTIEVSPALSLTGAAIIHRDSFSAEKAPLDANSFMLAMRKGNRVYINSRLELESGETGEIGDVNDNIQTYTGMPNENAKNPDYSSTKVITQGDDLTTSIGDLDSQVDTNVSDVSINASDISTNATDIGTNATNIGTNATDIGTNATNIGTNTTTIGTNRTESDKDRTMKVIRGGTWSWVLGTNTLTWSADANVQIASLAETVNVIAAASVVLANDGDVASVQINRSGPGGSLSVSATAIASLALSNNVLIFARRVGDDVLIGNSFLLKDDESLELDGALAEINRVTGRLRITEHESDDKKARVAAGNVTLLNGETLNVQLQDKPLDFSGAVINFDTGDVLKEDDSTALGDNFTPFAVPVSDYAWYGIGLFGDSDTAINKVTGKLNVDVPTSSNATQNLAVLPNITAEDKRGWVQVFNNAGDIEIVDVISIPASGGGTGGAKTLATLVAEDFESTKAADLTSGNSAVFGASGTLQGTIVDEEAAPLSGDRSMKYTQAAGSLNDWVHLDSVVIQEKEQGNFLAYVAYAKYDGGLGEVKMVAYDATNGAIIGETFIQVDSVKRHTIAFLVPTNTTEVKIGFQVASLNNGAILEFDDIELTQEPFAAVSFSNDTNFESYTPITQGLGTISAVDFKWRQTADAIEIHGSMTIGTVTGDEVKIGLPNNFAVKAGLNTKHGGIYFRDVSSANNGGANIYTSGDTYFNVSGSSVFSNSAINPLTPVGGSTAFGGSENVTFIITIPIEGLSAFSDGVIVANASAANSEITVNTANGYGSTNTKIRRFTNLQVDLGTAITFADSATDGASFTINEDGEYKMDLTDSDTDTAFIGISVDSSQLTTNINAINVNDRVAMSNISGANQTGAVSRTRNFVKGQIVRVHGQNAAGGVNSSVSFSITKIGTTQVTGVPFPLTAYIRDEKSSGTAGGTFTAGSYQTRTINIIDGDTSFSSLNNNQITISPGTYEFDIQCTADRVNIHKAKLRNIDDSTDAIIGINSFAGATDAGYSTALIKGRVVLTESKTFEVQHRCQTTNSGDGFGAATVFGDVEVYLSGSITKIK